MANQVGKLYKHENKTHPRAVGRVTGIVSVPRADQRGQSLPEGTPGSHPWVTVPAGGKLRQTPHRGPQHKLLICLPNEKCHGGNESDFLCESWQPVSDSLIPHQPRAPHGHIVIPQWCVLTEEPCIHTSLVAAPLGGGEKREPATHLLRAKTRTGTERAMHFTDGEHRHGDARPYPRFHSYWAARVDWIPAPSTFHGAYWDSP